LDKLFTWLHIEPVGYKWWSFAVKVIIATTLMGMFFDTLLSELGAPLRDEKITGLEALEQAPLMLVLVILPIAALGEELVFRLPLALFIHHDARPVTILIAALVLSVLFGGAHGGWWQIPVQGVGGFIFCLAFLKCGGLKKKYGKALFSGTAIHLGCNWFFFGIQLLSL
jgi:membrane protease YdiL (CAAX protease family)